ncbi:DUF99 family protein [Gloeocapsopsis crepidinum LEGE 06123]|uniref:DUF99 family protein n=1 Tax=Gloeocapsopsis crepidinum LEGE 06123 TaxID=588587 RepID=A0ABR9UVL4_9CHRO|nr:DUF99 family protein [Gloeocapsopsis crepidinum]MBE9192346.1 DUF99 family protein [Gloeocapsopsis crepidinum LEGE 06123]
MLVVLLSFVYKCCGFNPLQDLETLLRRRRTIRVIGFDDAPFSRLNKSGKVCIAGVVCADTRFEGMVWGEVQQDGLDATEIICQLLLGKKFLPQLHILLLDGIAFGGFNIIDLPLLSQTLLLPCVTVMRRLPNLQAMQEAIQQLPQSTQRLQTLQHAGTIYQYPPFFFQVSGVSPEVTFAVLQRLTDRGKVPEALRLAHLIGAAVVKGESGKSA